MRNTSSVFRIFYVLLAAFRNVYAAPISAALTSPIVPFEEAIGSESAFVFRLVMSVVLVLLGGVFAGLTIGLMGQDEVFLHVTMETGDEYDRKHAAKVLDLLAYGKHWVLVTLLLSNVITNETLPIMLDRILGGGWPAVLSSTAAIVVFGEIIPQSICVRYGLPLGAYFAPFVKVLMYLLYPIAVPIAKILDYMLGEDHGTIYKKAGLKSLVSLHHHIGIDRLNEDEVTIISAVLDLKDKPVQQIMTPMKDVFILSSETILDEEMVEKILVAGFNRIPIHAPNEPLNFVGMLLVRTLITYDPDDKLPISSFALATLPETSPDTSCLNILNYFQEGKAHMVAVSTDPGAVHGAVGVVTLEDVIEELIGEEIVDESDVYVDVQRAIRRVTPAPVLRFGHLNHNSMSLKPSNKASDPIATKNSKITIKRGGKTPTTGSPHEESIISQHQDGKKLPPRPQHGYMPALHFHPQYCDDPEQQSRSISELAKSPGSFVTKIPDQTATTEVLPSERETMISNLGPEEEHHTNSGPSKVLQINRKHPSISSLNSSVSNDDARSQAFSENVVSVNGVNKVVIQEISSSSSESE